MQFCDSMKKHLLILLCMCAAGLPSMAAPAPASSLPELQRIHNKIAGAKFKSSDSRWSQKRILQLLPHILNGEDVNVSLDGMKGNTCLHYACELGSRDLIRWLVENGADVNRVEWGGGNTPLHCSARLASLYSVNYLLEHGANPDIANNEGLKPVDMVGNDDHDAICAALRTASSGKERMEYPEILGNDAMSILRVIQQELEAKHYTSPDEGSAHYNLLQLIPRILSGEGVDFQTDPNAAIHYACMLGSRDLIRWLVENGAKVNRQGRDGNTPLHCAAQHGDLETVRYLLENGADPGIVNTSGETPADSVGDNNREAICAVLRAAAKTSVSAGVDKKLYSIQENLRQGTLTPYNFTMVHEGVPVQPRYDWVTTSSPKEIYQGMEGGCLKTTLLIGGHDYNEQSQQITITWDARTLLPLSCIVEIGHSECITTGISSLTDEPTNDTQENTCLLARAPELLPLLINRDDHFGSDVLGIDTKKMEFSHAAPSKGCCSISLKNGRASQMYEYSGEIMSVSNTFNGCRTEHHVDFGDDADPMPNTNFWFYDARNNAHYIEHDKNASFFESRPAMLRVVGGSRDSAVRLHSHQKMELNTLFGIRKHPSRMAWLVASHEDCQLYILDPVGRTATLLKEWIVRGSVQWDEKTRRLAIPLEENFFEVYKLDADTAEPVHCYNVITDGAGQYALVLPDGRYAGTPGCEQFLTYHTGGQSAGMRPFAPWLNRPGEVLEALGGDARTAGVLKATTARWLAKLGIASGAPMPQIGDMAVASVTLPNLWTDDATLRLPVQVEAKGLAVDGLEVKVNGNRLKDAEPPISVSAGSSAGVELSLPLEHGQNWIEVTPRDAGGREGLGTRFRVLRRGEADKRRFVVALGVSRYANLDVNLKYAAKDARDVADAFGALGASASVRKLVLTDEAVTSACMEKVRGFLADAGVDDEIILFCAGHGVRDDKLNYYYCGYDFDAGNPGATGISMESLLGVLSESKARHKLVLLDTCHAGNVGEADEEELARSGQLVPGSGALATRGMRLKKAEDAAAAAAVRQEDELEKRYIESVFSLPNAYSGMNIIAAVSGARLSLEDDSLGNGVFSKGIIDALQNGARHDLNRDAIFSVTELFAELSRSVPLLSEQVLRTACARMGRDYEAMKDQLPAPMMPSAVAIEKDQNFALARYVMAPDMDNFGETTGDGFSTEVPLYVCISGKGVTAADGTEAPSFVFQPYNAWNYNFYWPLGNRSFCISGNYAITLEWKTPHSGTAVVVMHSPRGNKKFRNLSFQCHDVNEHGVMGNICMNVIPKGKEEIPSMRSYYDAFSYEHLRKEQAVIDRYATSLDAESRELLVLSQFLRREFSDEYAAEYARTLKCMLPRIILTKMWDMVGPSGNTALHYTAALGNQKITKWLVEHGANINARNNDGQTPLDCLGVNKSGLDKWLIQHGAVRSHELRNGNAVLMENGITNIIDSWNNPDPYVRARRSTPFNYSFSCLEAEQYADTADVPSAATSAAQDTQVSQSSQASAEPTPQAPVYAPRNAGPMNATEKATLSAKAKSARKAGKKSMATQLESIRTGGDINATYGDSNGNNALNYAAYEGDADLVRLLLAHGADLGVRNNEGWDPIIFAVFKGRTECVRVLLEAGADANRRTPTGSTLLMVAAMFGHTDIIRALVSAGADMHATNPDGYTALYLAESKNQTAAAALLRSQGATKQPTEKYSAVP